MKSDLKEPQKKCKNTTKSLYLRPDMTVMSKVDVILRVALSKKQNSCDGE